MPKRASDYRSELLEDLKDPIEASHYLNAALYDSPEMFLLALRDVAESHQMAKVAESAGVSRESLYRMLGASGNPTYVNLLNILKAVGVEYEVRPHALERNEPGFETAVRARASKKRKIPKRPRSRRARLQGSEIVEPQCPSDAESTKR